MTYIKRYHYTEDELFRWALDDLVIDLRCAIRDGLTEYAAKVDEEIWRMIGTVAPAQPSIPKP